MADEERVAEEERVTAPERVVPEERLTTEERDEAPEERDRAVPADLVALESARLRDEVVAPRDT